MYVVFDKPIKFSIEGISKSPFSLGAIDIEGVVTGAEIDDHCPDDAPDVVNFDIARVEFFDYWREKSYSIDPRLCSYVMDLITGEPRYRIEAKIQEEYQDQLREERENLQL